MMTIHIGPLALPTAPLLALVALMLTTWAVRRISSSDEREAADTAVWWAAAVGLLAARAAHVLWHWGDYALSPLNMLDIRDGGFVPLVGALAGLGFLFWRLRGTVPQSRRPVLVTVAAGVVLWSLAGQALQWWRPASGQNLAEIAALLQPVGGGAAGDARAVTLRDIQQRAGGKPVVVNLWASWCGPCRAEMPILARAQRDNPDVLFLMVNQGESESVIHGFLQREGLSFSEVWRDPVSALGPALGSSGLPTTVVFDAQGQRRQAHLGVLTDAGLRVMLRGSIPRGPLP